MAASKKVRQKLYELKGSWCNGCGRSDVHISCSHRIPERLRPDLKDDLDNLDPMGIECGCHDNVECGRYHLLEYNGQEIMTYIKEKDPAYYELKAIKIERRDTRENNSTITIHF